PNGSGKSTLLRIVTNVARATRGTVDVFGRSTGSSDEVRRRIGFLSQQTYLYGELTARENLRFAAVMYGLPPSAELLDGSLADVGLT
ncbi:MAG: ATP-binding cassette domain-containing protein, partial [Gemmatimonadetes bacterium]|nr:ATP-binding cassette domain-containing protein [Gemmatimonadota bacterium]NIS00701.1 ATP-binding cassette domain-containing protein [Gemmatimonadota bacterium]NIT66278.1 ATP-binding cassette domain-containing protein [Gemmatimonadota bacterium]NIU54823.1 ATP-binding cassette domain-containing protein [Gemmatimonadota bacterium]NIV22834.1 ATP-binding cassette domain-containing protein [Gemmatimonadota bacterium]